MTRLATFQLCQIGLVVLTHAQRLGQPARCYNATARPFDSHLRLFLSALLVYDKLNYDTSGTAFPLETGKTRDWRYNEFELYAQDNWRARNDLTITYGARWHYYPAPYEADGFQACHDVDWRNLFDIRAQNAARGVASESSDPSSATLFWKEN